MKVTGSASPPPRKESDHELVQAGNPPGGVPGRGLKCTGASFIAGGFLESLPSHCAQGRGPPGSPVFLHCASTIRCPTAGAQYLLVEPDGHPEGETNKNSQSHGQVYLPRTSHPVSAVDNAANTPLHPLSARGGGHLGVAGAADRGAPSRPPSPRPLVSAAS